MKKALFPFLLLLSVAIPATTMAQAMAALVGMPQQHASSDFSPKQTVQLKQLLNDLGHQFRVNILFEESTLPDIQVSSDVLDPNLKLDRQLNTLLKSYGLMYKKLGVNSYLIVPEKKKQPANGVPMGNLESLAQPENLLASSQAVSMAITVTGRVTDDQQQGLPGVSVVLKGTTQGTATDSDGRYSLTLPDGNGTLVFSFIGYLTEEVAVSNRTNIDVKLLSDIKSLSELVVVGYGTQQKKDVTGAISSISAKDFQAQPVTRLDQALQGRVPGVQVTSNSGAPGGDVKIRIRGSNSIYGDNNPLYVVDGFIGADFRSVNPEDIESMQVLKDASATAVYGSRGANGVILITTKKGTSGKMQVNLMSRFSTSEILNTYDLLNAGEFAETANAARAAVNAAAPLFSTAEVNAFKQNGGTDWQKEIFRQAKGMEYQLGMSGGSDKMNYLISANYLDQDGILINSGFKRYSLRTNLTSQISEKFSVRLNLNAIRRETLNSQQGNLGRSSPITQALSWAPTTPVSLAKDPTGSIFQNPVGLALNRNYESLSTSSNIVGGFRYQILDGLSLDIGYGANYENIQDQRFAARAVSDNGNADASRGSYELINLQNVNNLTYTRVFNDVHHLTLTGVFEQQSYTLRGFGAEAKNLTFPSLGWDNIALAESNTASTAYTRSTLRSFLGRVNYSFQNKYLLTASLRRDGSSKFQGNNKYSVFPSIGLGWRLSEEAFMKNLDVFSNIKIRGGWGITGNQAIPAYGTFSSYISKTDNDARNAFHPFNNSTLTPGIYLGDIGNAGLKWETTEQINIGTDIELLKGSLAFSFDYFVKNTSDLLLNEPIAPYYGGGIIIKNAGNVQNKGIELSLSATPVSTKDFSWNSAFNISFLNNKVVNLGNVDTLFTGSNVGAGLSSQSEFVLIEGQPLGSNWGLQYLGTWKPNEADEATKYDGAKPGDSRYQDLNNDGQITTQDFQIIGRSQPRTSLGWNNTFTYKGLSLNIFIQSLLGFDKLNYTYGVTMSPTGDVREYLHADIKDRYIPGVNETSEIPAFSSTNKTYYQSSRFIQKGDFVRLKNISLSYTLPTTLVKNVGVQIFVTGTNLLTWTKYKGFDPESTSVGSGTDINQGIDYGSYPNSRTYVAGLRVQF